MTEAATIWDPMREHLSSFPWMQAALDAVRTHIERMEPVNLTVSPVPGRFPWFRNAE
jgi:hypothetical protein